MSTCVVSEHKPAQSVEAPDKAGSDRLPPPAPGLVRAWLCVLASGSSGNCTIVVVDRDGVRRACLIDLGLSPRRTIRLLAALGLGMHCVDDVILTHLDRDHLHPGWAQHLPRHVVVRMHRRHQRSCAQRGHRAPGAIIAFDDSCGLRAGPLVRSAVMDHDDLGSCAFRLDCGSGELGFATDLGRVTDRLIRHLAGVDVLAIESNYCPRMQAASGRPEFLKRRITGGAGHLSNEQALDATQRIAPREHVVLLHLSRECNERRHAQTLHQGSAYALTVSCQVQPTPWIPVHSSRPRPPAALLAPKVFQPLLFSIV